MGSIADTSKDGLISFTEFQAFEGLLCTPDALYKTAFQLFDTNGNGTVNYNEFCEIIKKTDLHQKIPFHLDGPFIQRYFAKVNYNDNAFDLVCFLHFTVEIIWFGFFRTKQEESHMPNSRNYCTISTKSMPKKHSKVKIQMERVTYHRLISLTLWSMSKNICSHMMLKIIWWR